MSEPLTLAQFRDAFFKVHSPRMTEEWGQAMVDELNRSLLAAQPAHQPAAAPVAGALSKKTIALKPLRERLDDWLTGNASFNSESEYQAALDRMEAALTPSPVAPSVGGTVGLDGDTQRDWYTDGPAWEKRALEAEERLAPVATEETQRQADRAEFQQMFDFARANSLSFEDLRVDLSGRYATKLAELRAAQPPAGTPEQAPLDLQPLKDALDREWKDETPQQIVIIAANGIFWRTRAVIEKVVAICQKYPGIDGIDGLIEEFEELAPLPLPEGKK